ncbi:isoleucine--tRNA ligase, cytoplasmic-like [Microplitis mediator]|uniref:isoleucine--tRNA ligase, cytoplasmic-like n=1 Tax=Microplitis mediator TaxID=375433 RepID=UPI0025578349|nr:isoleucine--tRNA ligase, cytoplasmic-like [Microplitis mediator]
MREKLPETINFPQEEEKLLKFWADNDVFQNSLQLSKGRPRFSFYDGPPFATGLPHYGHILAGTIKDVVTRYAHQDGYYVERRFGWDTHGLPVEFEVEKALGIKGPEDVAKMGIDNYNKECRSIVMKYSGDWEKIVGRMGRWIDFKNDYKTLYPWFMESVWWVFKELYNKGLVYQGVKVMPFSTGCNTPLSNFEAGLNYKEVIDPSIYVAFPLKDEPGVSLIAWTTTPWTLPSNLALCCNQNFEYVLVKDKVSRKTYILLESALAQVYKSDDLYEIIGKKMGSELKGKRYEPPFNYFEHFRSQGAFQVLNDSYVTAETGTGIVHQAPYFGEDDYRCNLQAGIITKDQNPICPVDSCGKFTEQVKDFSGMYVKDADKEIIKVLLANGKCLKYAGCSHSYPYCWRSDTPLIYKAVPSWFIRVESIKDKLLSTTAETYWVPDYVKDKRFGNWLRDARDWAVSRNRYWGNPMPLWISDDKKEVVCVGSIAELEELTGTKVTDIHRESIDHLTIPSRRGPNFGVLKRIPEIFDCWFESGSMPYAQMHYPFDRVKDFEESFPADFIAEGIDQTRGWFYTLLVISTALFDKPPFKNLVCNGLVLAADGQKMSKSKKNYPDPMEIINRFGADALRLYLINSPVVRAENLRFKEEGVRDVIKDVFLPWFNAFRFLNQNIERFETEEKCKFVFHDDEMIKVSDNIMDKWILSFTQTLLKLLKEEMKAYKLYNVVPKLVKYIDNLTNWYVRMNRKRIKGDGGTKDCEHALNTLFYVIYTMVRINAPFTPFLSEFMYQRLLPWLPKTKNNESVHYQMIPAPREQLINEEIERAVYHMQTVIDLGRIVRDRKTIPVKYPLPEVVIIHQDPRILEEIVRLKSYILEELNVKEMTVTTDKQKYGVVLRAEPDHKTLGVRLRGEFKAMIKAIKELTDDQLQEFLVKKEIVVNQHVLEEEDLRLMFSFSGPTADQLSQRYEAHSEGNILILLDITPDESMQHEGIAREIINRVQKLRKKAQLVPTDAVDVYYEIKDSSSMLKKVIDSYKEFIESTTKTPQRELKEMASDADVIVEEMQKIKGVDMNLVLVKRAGSGRKRRSDSFLKFVNVKLVDVQSADAKSGELGVVLLQSPRTGGTIGYQQLRDEIRVLFGLYDKTFELYDEKNSLSETTDLLALHRKCILVANSSKTDAGDEKASAPACAFVNVKCDSKQITVMLENPRGKYPVSSGQLKKKLDSLFSGFEFRVPDADSLVALLDGSVLEPSK